MIESLHIKTVRRYFMSLSIFEILYLLFYWNTVRKNFFQVFFMISRTKYFTVLTHTHTEKTKQLSCSFYFPHYFVKHLCKGLDFDVRKFSISFESFKSRQDRMKMFPCGLSTFFRWLSSFFPQGSWVGQCINV